MVAPASNDDDDDKNTIKGEDVIDRLLVGYKRFRREKLTKRLDSKLKTLSREGQRGCKVLCVSCCDSRYDPTLVFNADPGEIFTVRNVANVIPRFVKHEDKTAETAHHGTCAAIEYAVKSLKVEAIVVLGHAQCGGCAHALSLFSEPEEAKVEKKDADVDEDDDGSGYVDAWCGLLKESVKRVCSEYDKDERLRQLEHENVRQSVENVKTFPFVRDRIAKGELKVRGGFFTIFSGGLCVMDEETKVFERIKDDDEHTLESEEEKAASKVAPELGGEKDDDENVDPPPRSVVDDNKSNKRQKKK
jgi:carbonic anhydrase